MVNERSMDAEAVRRIADESITLQRRFFEDQAVLLLEVGRRIEQRIRSGNKVLVFGNGGSAADAQHFAAELLGRYQKERAALPAVALAADVSTLTAIANDLGYAAVFARQVAAHGRAGDVAVAISTSGRSLNVLQGLKSARERGLMTVGLSGNGGGEMPPLCDYLIDVPHTVTARIQEVHGVVIHILCQIVEEGL